jgi:fructoselysine-6-P-deglycase FrlB-like protein
MSSSFNVDVNARAQALIDLDRAPASLGLYPLVHGSHDRIILTGMGASHFAALPSWRRLVENGEATWWIDAGCLMASPELVTPNSLLIATSRSGACQELVALVEKFDEATRPAALIAITDDLASPLVASADCEVLLRSRSAGNPKSFLNALAAHNYLASLILSEADDDLASTARIVSATTCPTVFAEVASAMADNPHSRLAFVGFRDHAATSLYAGSLAKKKTAIASESFVGGQFRHDPLQLADGDLTAVLFGGRDTVANAAIRLLAGELLAAGSSVIIIGQADVAGAINIPCPTAHVTGQVAHGVVIAEHLIAALATQQSIRRSITDD